MTEGTTVGRCTWRAGDTSTVNHRSWFTAQGSDLDVHVCESMLQSRDLDERAIAIIKASTLR